MPVASFKPEAPTPVVANTPKITPPESKSIVVDTKFTPVASLLTYISGAKWTVDYYQQVIDRDNDIRGQDVGQSAIYQQYRRILGLELKVSSPLTQSQNDDDKRMVVTGVALIFPFMIPNEGDMFAADVGDGREGVFRIKSTEKKSFMKEAVYSIDYELVYYSVVDKARRFDLDEKSITTLHYFKDFSVHGQTPLLIEEDFNAVNKLGELFGEIAYDYFGWFYNREYSTLLLPGQTYSIYDNFVIEALQGILTTTDAPQLLYIRKLNILGDKYLKQPQFYTALLRKDNSLLQMCNQKMGLANTKLFSHDPMLESIAYSGITYLMYPVSPDKKLNNLNDPDSKSTADIPLDNANSSVGDLSLLIPTAVTTDDALPFIYPVTIDDSYVLSENFYSNTDTKSVLETLTKNYLENKAVNPSVLLKIVDNYKSWGGLERFYYLPIILILIRSIIRNT